MKKLLLLTLSITLLSMVVFSQNVGIGTNTPDSSALLELNSNSKGFLPPRLTIYQRNSIQNPAIGLVIFCSDCDELEIYNGTIWKSIVGNAGCVTPSLSNVTICNQVWTTKNLDVAKYRNGEPIPQVTDSTQWSQLSTGAWCWYNNDSANYAATYGRLYNWYAVNDPRGLAPSGWHIPTKSEWDKMSKCLDPTVDSTLWGITGTSIGTLLKASSGWNNGGNGNNSSGFTAVPGGYRVNTGIFSKIGNYGIWWTSTENDTTFAWHCDLDCNNAKVMRTTTMKKLGFSVRLVRD